MGSLNTCDCFYFFKVNCQPKGTPFVATSLLPVPATEFDSAFSTPSIKVNIQSLALVSNTLSFFFSAVLEIFRMIS